MSDSFNSYQDNSAKNKSCLLHDAQKHWISIEILKIRWLGFQNKENSISSL